MTTPRRVPFIWPRRVATALDGMVPGTFGGRVTGVAPVNGSESDDEANIAGASGTAPELGVDSFMNDPFTAATGAQDLTLTYLPIDYSVHVYLNGLEQLLGTDWTITDQTVSVLTAMGAVSGDKIDCLYAYASALPAVPDDDSTVDAPVPLDTITDSADHELVVTPGAMLIAAGWKHADTGTFDVQVKVSGTWYSMGSRSSAGAGTSGGVGNAVYMWSYVVPSGATHVKVLPGTSTSYGVALYTLPASLGLTDGSVDDEHGWLEALGGGLRQWTVALDGTATQFATFAWDLGTTTTSVTVGAPSYVSVGTTNGGNIGFGGTHYVSGFVRGFK